MVRVVTFVLGVLETNTYIVYDEATGDAVVVDPGDVSPKLVKFVKEAGLKVRAVLATHGHFDHVLGVDYLRNNLGVEFYMNREDIGVLESNPLLFSTGTGYWKPPRPDRLIEGDGELVFGSLVVRFIHTPGHTPGSTCYYIPSAGVLLSGDTLFRGSVGRTDLPGGSIKMLKNSIKKIYSLLPLGTAVYPGHGSSTTLREELDKNIYVISSLKLRK